MVGRQASSTALERMRPKRAPDEPTEEMRREHEVTHTPFKSWCFHCLAGAGRNDPHYTFEADKRRTIPQISMDYKYLGQLGDDRGVQVLVSKDSKTKMISCEPVPTKSVKDNFVFEVARNSILRLGYKKFIFKCDQEPAILELKSRTLEGLGSEYEAIPEESPVGAHQSNGETEVVCREVGCKARTFMSILATNYKLKKIDTKHAIVAWAVRYGGDMINRFNVGPDGLTAWERWKGKSYRRALVPFGEVCAFLPKELAEVKGQRRQLEPKMRKGVYAGLVERSDELVSLTPDGAVRARICKRLPEKERWDAEFFLSVRGVPWEPTPGTASTQIPVDIGEPEAFIDDDVPPPQKSIPISRRFKISRKDIDAAGPTPRCPGCIAQERGLPAREHTAECRRRMAEAFASTPAGKRRLDQENERISREVARRVAFEEEKKEEKRKKQDSPGEGEDDDGTTTTKVARYQEGGSSGSAMGPDVPMLPNIPSSRKSKRNEEDEGDASPSVRARIARLEKKEKLQKEMSHQRKS